MFASLDGDYYQSIRASFACLAPRLIADAVIVVDDYANEALPGAARATDAWQRTRTESAGSKPAWALFRDPVRFITEAVPSLA